MSKFVLAVSAGCVFGRAEFDEDLALNYAYLATATMCSTPSLTSNDNLLAWNCGPACDAVDTMTDVFVVDSGADNDAFVLGGKLNGECTITFRGTSDVSGWMEDLKSANLVDLPTCAFKGKQCKVGDGFLSNYLSLAPFLKGNLSNIGCDKQQPLVVTGHSLGAAEGSIAMFDLKSDGYNVVRTYTFGQPRVGDKTYVSAFEQVFADIDHFRVTHAEDPVPHLPFEFMGFSHLSTEVYYSGDTKDGFKICDGSGEDKTCANAHSGDVIAAGAVCASDKNKCAHLNYMVSRKTILMTADNCTRAAFAVV